jgi:glucokinase
VLKLTNNPWVLYPQSLASELGLDRLIIVNDFGAVGYAVAEVGSSYFTHIAGPVDLPAEGVTTVLGPGTGLGVAQVVRHDGRALVIETEGGHMDFAPLDPIEDEMLRQLRGRYQRVSVERMVAGPGLLNIYEALARIERMPAAANRDSELWQLALSGRDALASAALDRFCRCLGSVAGDLALAHGANAVVLAGGLGQRLGSAIVRSGFHDRFVAKGRFAARMAAIPIKLITHPQPGLFGAAAAFAHQHREIV